MTELQDQARMIKDKLGIRGYAKFMGAVVGVYQKLCPSCKRSNIGKSFDNLCPKCQEMAKEKLKKWT